MRMLALEKMSSLILLFYSWGGLNKYQRSGPTIRELKSGVGSPGEFNVQPQIENVTWKLQKSVL